MEIKPSLIRSLVLLVVGAAVYGAAEATDLAVFYGLLVLVVLAFIVHFYWLVFCLIAYVSKREGQAAISEATTKTDMPDMQPAPDVSALVENTHHAHSPIME